MGGLSVGSWSMNSGGVCVEGFGQGGGVKKEEKDRTEQ